MAKGKENNLEEKVKLGINNSKNSEEEIIIEIKSEDILGDFLGDMHDPYIQKQKAELAKKFGESFLTEIMIHKQGYKFCFHKSDDDKWPSDPHGHCKEKGYKINPYNGRIFEIEGKTQVDRIRKKHMESFWKELKEKGLDLAQYNPQYKEDYYKEHYA